MRALVSIFAGLLILISLYQLSFTWFVNQHEKEMGKKGICSMLFIVAGLQFKLSANRL